jgi:membrane protease YdiL (CAAX protease family)
VIERESPSFAKILGLILAVLVSGLILGYGYELAGNLVSAGWMAAMSLNLVLAVGAVVFLWHTNRVALSPRLDGSSYQFAYGAAGVILVGAVLLALASRLLVPGAKGEEVQPVVWAWVLLIPFVEELAFRVGIGHFFRKYGGPLWGAWFSAALFAWVHTQPTWSGVMTGELGIPLGPFLLGLICEYLYLRANSIWPIILMHAVCNGTVVIFSVIDARWFDWLGLLYS